MQLTGGYAASLGLTKVPVIVKGKSALTAGQRHSFASDSAADVSESTDSLPQLIQELQAVGGSARRVRQDRRASLEMPTTGTSAGSIRPNVDGTYTKFHQRVRGKAVYRTAASNSASHSRH